MNSTDSPWCSDVVVPTSTAKFRKTLSHCPRTLPVSACRGQYKTMKPSSINKPYRSTLNRSACEHQHSNGVLLLGPFPHECLLRTRVTVHSLCKADDKSQKKTTKHQINTLSCYECTEVFKGYWRHQETSSGSESSARGFEV